MSDRQAVLEAIAYGSDPKITPSDRLRALEQLDALDVIEATRTESERLTPEQALAEIESLAAAVPGWVAVARATHGGEGMAAIKPPMEQWEYEETIRAHQATIEQLKARVEELEAGLRPA
jgi:hypothetical protein